MHTLRHSQNTYHASWHTPAGIMAVQRALPRGGQKQWAQKHRGPQAVQPDRCGKTRTKSQRPTLQLRRAPWYPRERKGTQRAIFASNAPATQRRVRIKTGAHTLRTPSSRDPEELEKLRLAVVSRARAIGLHDSIQAQGVAERKLWLRRPQHSVRGRVRMGARRGQMCSAYNVAAHRRREW